MLETGHAVRFQENAVMCRWLMDVEAVSANGM